MHLGLYVNESNSPQNILAKKAFESNDKRLAMNNLIHLFANISDNKYSVIIESL